MSGLVGRRLKEGWCGTPSPQPFCTSRPTEASRPSLGRACLAPWACGLFCCCGVGVRQGVLSPRGTCLAYNPGWPGTPWSTLLTEGPLKSRGEYLLGGGGERRRPPGFAKWIQVGRSLEWDKGGPGRGEAPGRELWWGFLVQLCGSPPLPLAFLAPGGLCGWPSVHAPCA